MKQVKRNQGKRPTSRSAARRAAPDHVVDVRRVAGARSASRKPASSKPEDRSVTVKRIRAILGRTQTEMAGALGISAKAIQSYEQGWRKTPVRVMIQLLVLLALYQRQVLDEVPCWKIRRCPTALRKHCPAYTVGQGQFCWFIGNKHCEPPGTGGSGDEVLACMRCPVIQRLLKQRAEGAKAG